MQHYEYKVVAAPRRAKRAKGAKTNADRFAFMLSELMNAEAREGWEYLRADTLPCEQREGLMSKTTVFQNMLVFRRAKVAVAAPVVAAPNPGLAKQPPAKPPSAELAAE